MHLHFDCIKKKKEQKTKKGKANHQVKDVRGKSDI